MEERANIEKDARIRLNKTELNIVVECINHYLKSTASKKLENRPHIADIYVRLKGQRDGGWRGRPPTAPYGLNSYNNRSAKDRKKLLRWLDGKEEYHYW